MLAPWSAPNGGGPEHHGSRAVISRNEASGLLPSRMCLRAEPSSMQRHLAGQAQKRPMSHSKPALSISSPGIS